MARLLKTGKTLLLLPSHTTSSRSFINPAVFSGPPTPISPFDALKSPLESHILRLLRKDLDFLVIYIPPSKSVPQFDSFTVEDHPGEQYVTLKGKFSDTENVKIKATMSNAFELPSGEFVKPKPPLPLTLEIDVWKGEGLERLKSVCLAWPDRLEIQKVFISSSSEMSMRPYMGPNIRTMKRQLQTGFYDYLKMRGVNDDLCLFLDSYMRNKGRTEMIRWLKKIDTFVES